MLILFFIVISYCVANFYFYLTLSLFLNQGMFIHIITGLILLPMIISPVLIPIYSHRGSAKNVRIYSYVGYLWISFIVPFFPVGIILELYNVSISYSGSLFNNNLTSLMLSRESVFIIPLLLSIAINIYGYGEAHNLRVERMSVNTAKLPEGVDKLRVVQISDLHLGAIVGDSRLEKVIKNISAENPDIIVSTGDLVDGLIKHIGHLAAKLKNLHAPLGKYAVMGNHEIYGGIKNTAQFIEDSGFILLRGKGVTVHNMINIAGMDFTGGEARSNSRKNPQVQERMVLSGLPASLFTLLLKHRSDVEDDSLGLFDLQLSGHTHKGQIFPMSLAIMYLFKYHTGFTKLDKGSAIYVSRGTGTAGPPIRFLSSPEITVIDIVQEKTP